MSTIFTRASNTAINFKAHVDANRPFTGTQRVKEGAFVPSQSILDKALPSVAAPSRPFINPVVDAISKSKSQPDGFAASKSEESKTTQIIDSDVTRAVLTLAERRMGAEAVQVRVTPVLLNGNAVLEVPKEVLDNVASMEPHQLVAELFGPNVKLHQPATRRIESNVQLYAEGKIPLYLSDPYEAGVPGSLTPVHKHYTKEDQVGHEPELKYSEEPLPDIRGAQFTDATFGWVTDHSAHPDAQIQPGHRIVETDQSRALNTMAWPVGREWVTRGLAFDLIKASAASPEVFKALRAIGSGGHPVTFAVSGTTHIDGPGGRFLNQPLDSKQSPVFVDRRTFQNKGYDSESALDAQIANDISPLTAYVDVAGVPIDDKHVLTGILAREDHVRTQDEARQPRNIAYAAFVAEQAIRGEPVNLDAAIEAVNSAFPK